MSYLLMLSCDVLAGICFYVAILTLKTLGIRNKTVYSIDLGKFLHCNDLNSTVTTHWTIKKRDILFFDYNFG